MFLLKNVFTTMASVCLYVCLFVCLSVSLTTPMTKNYVPKFYEIFCRPIRVSYLWPWLCPLR